MLSALETEHARADWSGESVASPLDSEPFGVGVVLAAVVVSGSSLPWKGGYFFFEERFRWMRMCRVIMSLRQAA